MATSPVVPHLLTANGTTAPMVATPVITCKLSIHIYIYQADHKEKISRIKMLQEKYDYVEVSVTCHNKLVSYGVSPLPKPQAGDYPLSVVHGCLFNKFTATIHTWRPYPP
jgi:hypothetical protein